MLRQPRLVTQREATREEPLLGARQLDSSAQQRVLERRLTGTDQLAPSSEGRLNPVAPALKGIGREPDRSGTRACEEGLPIDLRAARVRGGQPRRDRIGLGSAVPQERHEGRLPIVPLEALLRHLGEYAGGADLEEDAGSLGGEEAYASRKAHRRPHVSDPVARVAS